MGAERWDEQVGSVADEAARLLESLRRSAADASAAHADHRADPVGTAAPAGGPADAMVGETAAHDPFCTWCPLCRSAAVVRSLSPETLTRLADLASVAAAALTDLARSRSGGTGEESAPPRRGPGAPSAPESRPIPIHDAEDPQEEPRG